PIDAVDALERDLLATGLENRRLPTSHAFHSSMMDPVLDAFAERLARVPFREPQRPYISNVTGTWADARTVCRPEYWLPQLRQPVQFSPGVVELTRSAAYGFYLEVGPGRALGSLVRQHPGGRERIVLNSIPQPRERMSDEEVVLTSLARIWAGGV